MDLHLPPKGQEGGWSPAGLMNEIAHQLNVLFETEQDVQVLPTTMARKTQTTLSDRPLGCHPTVSLLFQHVVPYLNRSSLSPRYYGFVTGGVTPAALAADVIVSYFDQNVQVHLPQDTIATTIEISALNMLLDLFRLPLASWGVGGSYGGGGTFTTGATASNVLGLAMGREWVVSKAAERKTGKEMSVGEYGLMETMVASGISKVQVLSTMPHSSVAKAASIIGIGRKNVIGIAKSGSTLGIDLEKLELEGSKPDVASILAISAGEVNTGRFATDSLEQLQSIRDICNRHGIWVHVDGAFGLFGRVLMGSARESEHAEIVQGCRGLELADSITGDGHKLLNVPYDCGFFFTRHQGLAEEVFRNGNAAYLSSGAGSGDGIPSPLNIGMENSRRFRALPVYATLVAYGRQGYVDMLHRQIDLARRIAGWLFDHAEFDLLPRGQDRQMMIDKTFMVVLFSAVKDRNNDHLVRRINETGNMYVTGTQWEGRPAARIAISNWQVVVERDANIIEEVLGEVIQ